MSNLNNLLNNKPGTYYLYNLDLVLNKTLIAQFHGIKYVCMQGSSDRAKEFAGKLAHEILDIDPRFFKPVNLFKGTRFECYRIGNILSVSHGMGTVSIITLLHNLTKLLHTANNTELEYIRIGTCGGININPGSIVITDTSYMPDLSSGYSMQVLGKDIIYPTNMNSSLNDRIFSCLPNKLPFSIYRGNSIAADDFYLGQARFDGVIKPHYDEKKRQEYFARASALNIYNIEMESTALAAFCNRASIPATMIAVTLLDRMHGDQITASDEEITDYADRAQQVVLSYLKSVR
jgi:uridine phosphorylase